MDDVQSYDDRDEGPLGETTYRRTTSDSWMAGQGSPANRSGPHDTVSIACRMQQIARTRIGPGEMVRGERPLVTDQIDTTTRDGTESE